MINKATTIFDSELTGTTVSAGIDVPSVTNYIIISSKRNKAIWLCDSLGNKQVMLPYHNEVNRYTYAKLEISGCTIKLQGDDSASGEVYVVAFHGV